MKKFGLITFLGVIAVCLLSTVAYANPLGTATLLFTGPVGPNNGYGYVTTVTGGPNPGIQDMMCITDFQYINYGEQWGANVYTPETAPLTATNVLTPFTTPSGGGGEPVASSGITTEDLIEAAWLFDKAKANPNNTDYNRLAWYLLDNTGENASAAALLSTSFSTVPTVGPGDVLVYIWDGDTTTIKNQYGSNDPQIFLGSTPEPSSLLLLGSGLGLLAFGIFRSKLIA